MKNYLFLINVIITKFYKEHKLMQPIKIEIILKIVKGMEDFLVFFS